MRRSQPWYVAEKAEAMTTIFLNDLKPSYVGRVSGAQSPYDYVAAFVGPNGAPVTVAIEVKATESELHDRWTIPLSPRELNAMTLGNMPVLIVAIDVKDNDLRFNWASELIPGNKRIRSHLEYLLPLRSNTENEREKLRREILNVQIVANAQ